MTKSQLELTIEGVELNVATIHRTRELPTIVFLHGFGSTKEDYADIVLNTNFSGYSFLAYDAPGCGETLCSDLSKISIPFLVQTVIKVLDHFEIQQFHLVGHSMGGLTALILAHENSHRILSFTDIEGNIAPEDCFLSRQIFDFPQENDEQFFKEFINRTFIHQRIQVLCIQRV